MAAPAAGPVYRLLGAGDLGVTEDYRTAQVPPVNTGLLEGELAWRQHNGDHEDRSDIPTLHRLGQSPPPSLPSPPTAARCKLPLTHRGVLRQAGA
jgi:hypothetical protein